MLSAAQNKFYWQLWSKLRKARPEVDRHAEHVALGLPQSHTEWDNAAFDRWKGHCLAQAQPGNYVAQMAQIRMPATRKLVFIAHLLTALERGEEYAEQIVSTMQRKGLSPIRKRTKAGQSVPFWGAKVPTRARTAEEIAEKEDEREAKPERTFRTLENLDARELEKVMIALKKECRRRWAEKGDLLGEIYGVLAAENFDRATASGAVMSALNIDAVPQIEKLVYENLLIVLSALRSLVTGAAPVVFAEEPEPVDAESVPF